MGIRDSVLRTDTQQHKSKGIRMLMFLLIGVAIVILGYLGYYISKHNPDYYYNSAIQAIKNNDFAKANYLLSKNPDYKDSKSLVHYLSAEIEYEKHTNTDHGYDKVWGELSQIPDPYTGDCSDQVTAFISTISQKRHDYESKSALDQAISLIKIGDYTGAADKLRNYAGDDVKTDLQIIYTYANAMRLMNEGTYDGAYNGLIMIPSNYNGLFAGDIKKAFAKAKQLSNTSNNTVTSSTTNYGNRWRQMGFDEKFQRVSNTIQAWRDAGNIVTADENYFIEGLNSFYGSPETDTMSYDEAISMLAISGGVLKKN